MRLWRVAPFAPTPPKEEGGPLWCPRPFQGGGRHDNPDLYGILYLSADPAAALVEALAPFRGTGPLTGSLLRRGGRPLMLVGVDVSDDLEWVDLDDPVVLTREGLRPSHVATRQRTITQSQARTVFATQHTVGGIAWWSTFESSWLQYSIFDRSTHELEVAETVPLTVDLPEVVSAARWLGLA
ncbi:MAG: RES domain-containing protein [Acidimicrobiales bacterium]